MADFNTPRISEKKYYSIPDQPFVADGTSNGLVTIASTYGYKVGMFISLKSDSMQPRILKINRIISETQFHVGDDKTKIWQYSDITGFLVSDNAVVCFSEQERPVIHINEIQRQIYEEEPTIALRTMPVDWMGRPYTIDNPLPTKSTDTSTSVDLELRFDEVSSTVMYLGEASIGSLESEAKWKIKKIEITGELVSIKYASGNFDKIWNDRASLIYV